MWKTFQEQMPDQLRPLVIASVNEGDDDFYSVEFFAGPGENEIDMANNIKPHSKWIYASDLARALGPFTCPNVFYHGEKIDHSLVQGKPHTV